MPKRAEFALALVLDLFGAGAALLIATAHLAERAHARALARWPTTSWPSAAARAGFGA